jgi:hypothetical protein
MQPDTTGTFELGAWLGRAQALGMIANHCSAAQAECLRQIRDTESYKSLGLTWDEFCAAHAGLTRRRVDVLIHSLEEFGAAYFRLSEITRVSPQTYRQLASKVAGASIEIDGEAVAISPENALRIRTAVNRMRADLQKSKAEKFTRTSASVTSLQTRLDGCFEEMSCSANRFPLLAPEELNGLRALVHYSIQRLNRVSKILPG